MIPTCVLCDKFSRTCIYEKQTRTPLTRRYLTEVEDELARTKALLLQLAPDANEVSFTQSLEEPAISHHSEFRSPSQQLPHNVDLLHHGQNGPMGLTTTPGSRSQYYTPRRVTDGGKPPDLMVQQSSARQRQENRSFGKSDKRSHRPSGLSLETPPSLNSFEWDERSGNAGGDKFVDGMASLTSDANQGGYLGTSTESHLEGQLLT